MDFVTENTGASNLTVDILGTMFKVCLKLCVVEPSDVPEVKDFTIDDETKLFVIRVMVGLVVLYDHVNEPNGAFNKGKIYVMTNLSYVDGGRRVKKIMIMHLNLFWPKNSSLPSKAKWLTRWTSDRKVPCSNSIETSALLQWLYSK